MSTESVSAPRQGRPRDKTIRRRVIQAAIECFAEEGWNGFHFEAVARRANVGRPALYRRWRDRTELLIDAIVTTTPPIESPDLGDVRSDLLAIARDYAEMMKGARGWAGARLFVERHAAPEVFEAVSSRVSAQREAAIYTVLERGKERGELRPDADITVVPHLLVGGIHAMRVFPGAYGDPEGDFVTQMVDVLLAGIAGENT